MMNKTRQHISGKKERQRTKRTSVQQMGHSLLKPFAVAVCLAFVFPLLPTALAETQKTSTAEQRKNDLELLKSDLALSTRPSAANSSTITNKNSQINNPFLGLERYIKQRKQMKNGTLILSLDPKKSDQFGIGGAANSIGGAAHNIGGAALGLGSAALGTNQAAGLQPEKQKEETSFLYLSDKRDSLDKTPTSQTPTGLVAVPDFSSLLAPQGRMRGSLEQDIESAGARLGLSLGNEISEDGSISPGFEIALQSAYRLIGDSMQQLSMAGVKDQTADREYNLGLLVGYSGFNLDASMSREWNPFESESIGLGLGVSYQSTDWSARLAWNDYTAGKDLTGLENEDRSFISVELGANLRLTDRVGLSGGVRYYNYENRYLVRSAHSEESQLIFLGGHIRF